MTEIKKLEIKHIQHYPIGGENAMQLKHKDANVLLVGIQDNSIIDVHVRDSKYPDSICPTQVSIEECKPYLRPMSDLYKPLKNRIYPIAVIGRMYEPNGKLYCEDGVYTYGWNTHVCDDYQGYEIGWIESAGWFGLFFDTYDYENQSENFTGDYIPYSMEIAEYLDRNHFDWRYNLIEQGLAINKNDIE